MKEGDNAKISPRITGEQDWIEGEIIDIENNPFIGVVISIKDKLGGIFFACTIKTHHFCCIIKQHYLSLQYEKENNSIRRLL